MFIAYLIYLISASRALRRVDSNAVEGMAIFGQWLKDSDIAKKINEENGEVDTKGRKLTAADHKALIEGKRRAMEEERRAILWRASHLTASAIRRRKLAQRSIDHWGMTNHSFRLTRAFVWSYFSLLQWLRVDNENEKLPNITKN